MKKLDNIKVGGNYTCIEDSTSVEVIDFIDLELGDDSWSDEISIVVYVDENDKMQSMQIDTFSEKHKYRNSVKESEKEILIAKIEKLIVDFEKEDENIKIFMIIHFSDEIINCEQYPSQWIELCRKYKETLEKA